MSLEEATTAITEIVLPTFGNDRQEPSTGLEVLDVRLERLGLGGVTGLVHDLGSLPVSATNNKVREHRATGIGDGVRRDVNERPKSRTEILDTLPLSRSETRGSSRLVAHDVSPFGFGTIPAKTTYRAELRLIDKWLGPEYVCP